MRISWNRLAVVAVAGLWAGSASAQYSAVNFGNVTTRSVLVQTEDTPCTNGTDPNAAPPAYGEPDAGCFVHANSGGADFTDKTNDFFGILSKHANANEWVLEIPQPVWAQAVATTLSTSTGGTLISNSANRVRFNTVTGAVFPDVGTTYYTATAVVSGITVGLTGEPSTPDKPFKGNVVNPLPPPLGIPLMISCLGASTYPGALFGPAFPGMPICDPGTNYTAQPGFSVTSFTAFARAKTELGGVGSGALASSPVLAPFDWKLWEAANADADIFPDLFDNCRVVTNPTQCNATPADGWGNQCDPDTTNTGLPLSVGDVNAFRTAFNTGNPATIGDMNCSNTLSVADVNLFRGLFNNTVAGRLDSCLSTPPNGAASCTAP